MLVINRGFITLSFLLLCPVLFSAKPHSIVVEAENFKNTGNWVIDQQSIDHIGSAYLLAHGLGNPCSDATTTVSFPECGKYHVWVYTRNWAISSQQSQSPGRFRLLVNGEPLDSVFGQDKSIWNWHYGGFIKINELQATIALHDLTGFEGRCDAIIFSTDSSLIRHHSEQSLTELRKKIQGFSKKPKSAGHFDLVVVGGGVAGMTTSVTAARKGLKVALIHDRPVLGGNNSSEVRISMASDLNIEPYQKLGNITKELNSGNSENKKEFGGFNDDSKLKFILNETNITLFTEMHVIKAIVKHDKIQKVIAKNIRSNEEYQISGTLFADCTGDGNLGFLAGADSRYGRESIKETGESLAPGKTDSLVLGAGLYWGTEQKSSPVFFPECPWAFSFTEESCQNAFEGAWNWEIGFQYDMVKEVEHIRDNMFRSIYGNWAFQKNYSSVKSKYQNHALNMMGYVLGKRESRRLLGDIIYSQSDIDSGKYYPDACVSTRWGIDLHYPDPVNSKYFPGNEFRSISKHEQKGTHPVRSLPYRCLYSRNITNLFMAGRCASMTHIAHGMFRTQHTTGMMGEVVGMAAWLCKKNNTNPRNIYTNHWNEMKALLEKGL
jgi:hypothetical protein